VRPGRPWNKAHIYRLLTNPTYVGIIKHKDKRYPGLHEPLVEQATWDQVQSVLSGHAPPGARASRSRTPALLKGILRCGQCGTSMGVTFARKQGRTYRYYLCQTANKQGYAACPVKTVSAGTVEAAVVLQVRKMLRSPDEVTKVLHAMQERASTERRKLATKRQGLVSSLEAIRTEASSLLHGELDRDNGFVREELAALERQRTEQQEELRAVEQEIDSSAAKDIPPATATAELARLDGLWDELFPAEQERLVRLLVEAVIVHVDRLEVTIRPDGLRRVVGELVSKEKEHAAGNLAG